jgi:hypothetical protein
VDPGEGQLTTCADQLHSGDRLTVTDDLPSVVSVCRVEVEVVEVFLSDLLDYLWAPLAMPPTLASPPKMD